MENMNSKQNNNDVLGSQTHATTRSITSTDNSILNSNSLKMKETNKDENLIQNNYSEMDHLPKIFPKTPQNNKTDQIDKDDSPIKKKEYEHTKTLCNKKLGFWGYAFVLLVLSVQVGQVFSFQAAISISFQDDGQDVKYKTILNLMSLPFIVIPLFGVLVDTRFMRYIGKSKTYVLICPIFYSTLLMILSFYIDKWQKDLMIWGFFFIYTQILLSLATYLTAIDAWINMMFEEKNKPLGSYGRFVGFAFGAFSAYNGFILMSSKEFCQDFLGQDNAILTTSMFAKIIAVYCVTSSLLVTFLVSEKLEKNPKVTSMRHICIAFKEIAKKDMTKKWIILCIFKSFGLDGIVQVLSTVLVNEGLDKEILVKAHTLSGVPVLVGTIFLCKVLKKGKIMTSIYWMIMAGIFLSAIDVYTYYDFKKNGDKNTLWIHLASDITLGWLKSGLFILETAQIAIMCDESLNSTHFAMMQVVWNVSNALPYLIGTFIIDFVSYYPWCALCAVYNIIFLIFSKKQFTKIDNADKSQFVLKKGVIDKASNKVQDSSLGRKSPIKMKTPKKNVPVEFDQEYEMNGVNNSLSNQDRLFTDPANLSEFSEFKTLENDSKLQMLNKNDSNRDIKSRKIDYDRHAIKEEQEHELENEHDFNQCDENNGEEVSDKFYIDKFKIDDNFDYDLPNDELYSKKNSDDHFLNIINSKSKVHKNEELKQTKSVSQKRKMKDLSTIKLQSNNGKNIEQNPSIDGINTDISKFNAKDDLITPQRFDFRENTLNQMNDSTNSDRSKKNDVGKDKQTKKSMSFFNMEPVDKSNHHSDDSKSN